MTIRDDEVKDLKVGDIIYECEYGTNIEVRVLSTPGRSQATEHLDYRTQWSWKAENTQTGEVIDYLLTEGLSHYGPRLYRQPQYARVVDGAWSYPRLGGTDLVEATHG